MKNSEFSPNCVDRSVEKLVKYEPDASEPELAGSVNFNELLPEAFWVVSRVARLKSVVPDGGRMPEFCPYAPPATPPLVLKSPTASNPTHLMTPGCAQRVAKSMPEDALTTSAAAKVDCRSPAPIGSGPA